MVVLVFRFRSAKRGIPRITFWHTVEHVLAADVDGHNQVLNYSQQQHECLKGTILLLCFSFTLAPLVLSR